MSAKPEALRLAEQLEAIGLHGPVAAELRRLHAENESLRQRHRDDNVEYTRVLAQRDALLEALRKIGRYTGEGPTHTTPWQDIVADLGQTARAAIKAVEGEKT